MSKKHSAEDLRWVRLYSPVNIPRHLIEQVRDRDYTVDEFVQYQELNCRLESDDGFTLNPFNHLYAMADTDNRVQGFLWFVIDPLSKDMVINTYSIDEKYWHRGEAVEVLAKHVKQIKNKLKLKKVYWLTNYPKHSQRHGFKRSKAVLMEYTGEQDGIVDNQRDHS